MQVLKRFFDFYINSSIHVGLAVVSLTWISLKEHVVLDDNMLLFFVFFATISGYNFVKYFGMAKFYRRRLATWLKAMQVFSFFSFLFMIYFFLKLNTKSQLYIGCFGLITFFYAIPFVPKKMFLDSCSNLRSIGGLKVYIIALVWTGVTVFIPLINNELHINSDVVFTAIQRFIFVVILMLPFEIRDLRYDSLKLATIPQKIGVTQTKIMGLLLLFVFFFLEFFKDEIETTKLLILVVISITTLLFLIGAKKEQGAYYSSFWVEGLPILWFLLLLVFS